MPVWAQLMLTIACALIVGRTLDRLRVPGGMMIGGVIGACLLSVTTGQACMPGPAKTAAQIVAGAFIGAGITREDIREMRTIAGPALILLPCLLAVNIAAGLIIYAISDMDAITALMCCTPGGISDIPIIAADMGADAGIVVVMQFVRLVMGIGVFPLMIRCVTGGEGEKAEAAKKKTKKTYDAKNVLLTLAVATVCGLIGKASPVPAGTMGFATLGSIVFSCIYPKAQMPRALRKIAQLLSGAYVGASMGMGQIRMLGTLGLPVIVLIVAYTGACFGIGGLLQRAGCFNRTEGMLAATPAGASDMALISADLGVTNAKLVVLQVMRLITVVLVFPTVLHFVAALFG